MSATNAGVVGHNTSSKRDIDYQSETALKGFNHITVGASALCLRGITKSFGSFIANDAINLTLQEGEILALLGENGAGKTTLMDIIYGEYLADIGSIEVFGKSLKPGSTADAIEAGIGMVHQHFTLAANMSVLDNIIVGTERIWAPFSGRKKARERLVSLSKQFGLNITPEADIGGLSVGECQRVEILKALYRNAKILIMDEPTAVLTPQEVDGLFATLRHLVNEGLSVILISHKLREIMTVADRILVLRRGRVVAERVRANTDEVELAGLMVGRNVSRPERIPQAAGTPVLRLVGVSLAPRRGPVQLDQLSFEVRSGEVFGIAGVSGNGQSALSSVLSGLEQPTAGRIELNGAPAGALSPANLTARAVARIPEDRHADGLVVDMTVWENLIAERYRDTAFSRAGVLLITHAKREAERLIEEFDVRGADSDTTVRLLSGGNMQKLILARTLSRGPGFILADQPIRGLDVGAIAEVHRRLMAAREAGAGILLITEDLEELFLLSDRVAVLYQGRLSEARPSDSVDRLELGLAMAGKIDHSAH